MRLREHMEERQIFVYVVALLLAGLTGWLWPAVGHSLERAIPAILGLLLFAMFSQIPFFRLSDAFADRRFIKALLVTNYLLVPLLVWGLVQLLPEHHPLLLGICLVLLTPCIDYVIVFSHLGGGSARLMLQATPLLFLTQILLLPVYLWLFLGSETTGLMRLEPFLEAFLGLIVLPFLLALAAQWWARRHPAGGERLLAGASWLPVPLMAAILFAVVASQVGKVYASFDTIVQVVPIYIAYMAITPFLSRWTAKMFGLDASSGRTLVFSAGTRNSLVVLPIALALPEPAGTLVAAVIVTQTIVELVGELIYIRIVPRMFRR